MVFTLTLVASKDNLSIGHLAEVETLLQDTGLTLVNKPSWLEKRVAADIFFSDKPNLEQIKSLREFLKNDQIDVFTTPSDQRKKKTSYR